jgi:hypothetical protein
MPQQPRRCEARKSDRGHAFSDTKYIPNLRIAWPICRTGSTSHIFMYQLDEVDTAWTINACLTGTMGVSLQQSASSKLA